MTNDELISSIRRYWRQHGYDVEIELSDTFRVSTNGAVRPYRVIKSNLVNGLPPGFRRRFDLDEEHPP
jgi:hypothetical protein